jgi:Peptidase_C39 like family
MKRELLTWTELNYLRAARVLPESFDSARIGLEESTPIYDLNGEELFWRTPLWREKEVLGYVDVAAHPALGEPMIAISYGAVWDEASLRSAGIEAARVQGIRGADRAKARFVAYSFPKVALQILRGTREVALLELYTWLPVPPSVREVEQYEPPSNFERWSFLDEMPDDERRVRTRRCEERVTRWQEGGIGDARNLRAVSVEDFLRKVGPIERVFALNRTRELHYSTRIADHHTCYELRGQETSVWCVAASVQMLLDFYRYEYSQVRLAQELGLGTLANPNGLPYANDGDVVTVIEAMSLDALNASMTASPYWSEFESEIDANRPLISFIPGHSRTIAGYTRSFISLVGQSPYRGLLVYDPWPPNAGVITRWENYNAMTYRRTFTARLNKA